MRHNPNQLELDFNSKDLIISQRFDCEHTFYTDPDTDHEVCETCGLVVPHEYILEHCDLKDWPDDAL